MVVKVDKQGRKDKVWNNVQKCCNTFNKCIFVNVDNVTSKQICVMRRELRAIGAKMVMGKNVSDTPFTLDSYEGSHPSPHHRR